MNSRRSRCIGALVCSMGLASTAAAQGPLTGVLPENDPATYAFRVGPLFLTPSVTIREVGIDTNVFDEPVDPKRDFVMTVSPDLSGVGRLGPVRVALSTSADMTYYHTFESERFFARQVRARGDVEILRIRPWIAGGLIQTRQRPNREIDWRARRQETEISAGAIYELSPGNRLFFSATRYQPRYLEGEIFEGIDLSELLSRKQDSLYAGLRLELTPFTTMSILGMTQDDRFRDAPIRNARSRMASAEFTISTDAIIRGRAQVGYRDFDPVDPTVSPYKGLYSNVGVAFTLFSSSNVAVNVLRDVQHSFEEVESYYVETSGEVVYTQLLGGPYDVQLRGSYGTLGYGRREGLAERADNLRIFSVGAGYNFEDRSRIGITYEYSDRLSEERSDRRFDRRRFFLSYTYTF